MRQNFYKPYLEKYESKYRILYHLLQQPGVLSTQEMTLGITPSWQHWMMCHP